jgi:cell pole-organizing protein PopZ
MEDILASIRRILSEDEAAAGSVAAPAVPPPAGEADMLTLDAAMLVGEPPFPAAPPPAVAAEREPAPPDDDAADLADPVGAPEPAVEPAAVETPRTGLVAPEAVAAAATSLNTLVRTLVEHQSMAVHRGGPTLEDIVREEIRPMLKAWLDTNLPPLVERLVRTEIERVIGRAVS